MKNREKKESIYDKWTIFELLLILIVPIIIGLSIHKNNQIKIQAEIDGGREQIVTIVERKKSSSPFGTARFVVEFENGYCETIDVHSSEFKQYSCGDRIKVVRLDGIYTYTGGISA